MTNRPEFKIAQRLTIRHQAASVLRNTSTASLVEGVPLTSATRCIPFQTQIFVNSVLVATTVGQVSGTGTLTIPSSTVLKTGDAVDVMTIGTDSGTAWDYTATYQSGLQAINYKANGLIINDDALPSSASIYVGTQGNDFLIGTSKNGTFTGGDGNDMIDGGNGIDTAVFGSLRSNYTVTKVGSSYVVTARTGTEGTDTLNNVENIKFADTTIALDIGGTGGQAYRVYQAAFNWTPDFGGLGFWINAMDGGATLPQVANGFVNSAEFRATYGVNPSNAQIVTKLYDNVLHRAGETGGFNHWVGVLDSHAGTVADVLAAFSESAENQAALISTIGNGFAYTPYL